MVWGAAGLPSIDTAFGEAIAYLVDGLGEPIPMRAPWCDLPGDELRGTKIRTVSCEIRYADLPAKPTRADRITRDGVVWKPNDVLDLDEMERWVVVLEKVGTAS